MNGIKETLHGFPARGMAVSKTGGNGELAELFVDGRAISLKNGRQQDGIGQSMGDAVFPAQRMGDGMDLSHIGFGKGTSGIVGSGQHAFAGTDIRTVPKGLVQAGENQMNGFPGSFPGIPGGRIPNVGFDGVGECIHAGGGSEKWRQADSNARI